MKRRSDQDSIVKGTKDRENVLTAIISRLRSSAGLKQAQFRPGLLGFLTNPYYIARASLWRQIQAQGSHIRARTLDVGCGCKPYRDLFQSTEYIGLELENKRDVRNLAIECFYDGRRFPFPDGSFDSVVCNQVIEHVKDPIFFLGEILRVLVPGGVLLITVPLMWGEHETPEDYWRFTTFGIRRLLANGGFTVQTVCTSGGGGGMLTQLACAQVVNVVSSSGVIGLLWRALITLPFNILGTMAALLVLPKENSGQSMYLDNVAVALKPFGESAKP